MDFSSLLANVQKTADSIQKKNSNDTTAKAQEGVVNSSLNARNRPPNSSKRSLDSMYFTSDRTRAERNQQSRNTKHPRRDRSDLAYRESKWETMKEEIDLLPKFSMKSTELTLNKVPARVHLCLLALTINDLPFEDIWKEWASQQQEYMLVSLIGHAKDPLRVQSSWFQSHLLVNPPTKGRGNDFAPPTYWSRCPQWGSIEITRAMLDLCHECLQIGLEEPNHVKMDLRFSNNRYGISATREHAPQLPKVDKILFISESCLPVDFFTKDVLHSPCSIVNASDKPNNGFSRQMQFEKINHVVPLKFKADQWMMISRLHLELIMTKLPQNFWECFRKCNASDELYFPTAMALLGILDAETSNSAPLVERRRITYSDWTLSAKNPVTFQPSDLEKVVLEARKAGCIVARKFVGVSFSEWKLIVLQEIKDSKA
jgi:Core-2/I-Branching enzyme